MSAFFSLPAFRLMVRSRPNAGRVLRGGRPADAGRLPRYIVVLALAALAIWLPISSYLRFTPASYTSHVSLILPGSGVQSSVNLSDLGQASSSAASAFASNRVSPTQTYKRLLTANRTLQRAADVSGLALGDFGKPQIKLVDETALIHFSLPGPSPEAAQDRAGALLESFLDELEALRADDLRNRDQSARKAIGEYEAVVVRLRRQIADLQAESGLIDFQHFQDLMRERDALAAKRDAEAALHRATVARMEALARRLGVTTSQAALALRLHADPEFQQLARMLSEHNADLATARGTYGPRHPRVTSLIQKVSGTADKLDRRGRDLSGAGSALHLASLDLAPSIARAGLLSDLVELDARCRSLATSVAVLDEQLQSADARLAALAPLATRLDDLSRDYQVAETVFTSALARTDTTKADVYASYPLVQVLADASLPERPTSPRTMIALAAGVASTLMMLIGLGLAWVRRPLIDRLLTRPGA